MDVVVVNVAIVIYGPQLQSKQQAVYYLIGNDTKDTLQLVSPMLPKRETTVRNCLVFCRPCANYITS